MASWSEFVAAEPGLASAIQELVHQYGPGLGFLATVRGDGGPRVHPVSPVITEQGFYCFIIDSPKRRDLERDGRYALHSFPPDASEDEAYLAGQAYPVNDRARVHELALQMRAEPQVDWRLFEFSVDTAMVVRRRSSPTGGAGAQATATEIWHDPARAA
jgi:Pyridoxamine 5'-phosphate oxidase